MTSRYEGGEIHFVPAKGNQIRDLYICGVE